MPAGRPRKIAPENRSPTLQRYYEDRIGHIAKIEAYRQERKTRPRAFMRDRLNQVKGRAKIHGLEFDLDYEWLDQQPLQCAVTGAQFVTPNAGWGPLTPSFDRINPSKGYLKSNTRLVADWFNRAKRDWPDEQIQNLILAAAEHITLLRSARD